MTRAGAGFFHVTFGDDRKPSYDLFGSSPVSATISWKKKKPCELSIEWTGIQRMPNTSLVGTDINIAVTAGFVAGERIEDVYTIKTMKVSYADGISVSIKAYDKGVGLGDLVSREVFTDVLASDIALIAAHRLGLGARIVPSRVRYPSVTMSGKTIGQVLLSLASNEDYEFSIRKGKLLFLPAYRSQDTVDYVLGYAKPSADGDLVSVSFEATAIANVAGDCRGTVQKTPEGEDNVASEHDPLYTEKTTHTFVEGGPFEWDEVGVDITSYELNQKAYSAFEKDFEELATLAPQSTTVTNMSGYSAKLIADTQAKIDSINPAVRLTDPQRYADLVHSYEAEMRKEQNLLRDIVAQQLAVEKKTKADAEKVNCSAAIIEQSPIKDPEYIALRNFTQATFARWKERKMNAQVYGVIPTPGDLVAVEGVHSDYAGPWKVEQVTVKWSNGDLDVSIECESPKPKKEESAPVVFYHQRLVKTGSDTQVVFDETTGARSVTTSTYEWQEFTVEAGFNIEEALAAGKGKTISAFTVTEDGRSTIPPEGSPSSEASTTEGVVDVATTVVRGTASDLYVTPQTAPPSGSGRGGLAL